MNNELNHYRVVFKVEPTTMHPSFREYSLGYLNIILFDFDPGNAARRATLICDQLPYKRIGDRAVVIQDTGESHAKMSGPEYDFLPAWLSDAQGTGYKIYFLAWGINNGGPLKSEFAATPFPGEPIGK